jgi:hypothetical protein
MSAERDQEKMVTVLYTNGELIVASGGEMVIRGDDVARQVAQSIEGAVKHSRMFEHEMIAIPLAQYCEATHDPILCPATEPEPEQKNSKTFIGSASLPNGLSVEAAYDPQRGVYDVEVLAGKDCVAVKTCATSAVAANLFAKYIAKLASYSMGDILRASLAGIMEG